MSLHGFRNTTGSPVVIGAMTVAANASLNFYDDAVYNMAFGADINAGVLENASSLNQILAEGTLVYTKDAVDQTPDVFYSFWHHTYNDTIGVATAGTAASIASAPGNSVVYYSNTVPRAITNTAAKTSLLASSVVLNVSTQAPGNITEIEATGSIAFAAQDASVAFTVMLGSVQVTTFSVIGSDITGLVLNTGYRWKLSAELASTAANAADASVSLNGVFSISTPTGILEVELQETAVVDTTKSNVFDITAQWAVAAANSAFINKIAAVRQMNAINASNLTTPAGIGAEADLGKPAVNGYVLSSTVLGVRSWVPMSGGSGGSGTVTDVGLTVPSIFTSGANVTTAGSLSFTLNSQPANLVLASPNGAAGVPSFRSIVVADISNLGSWVGSASIATLGTITAGVWNGTAVDVAYGGTGKSAWTQYGLVVASATTTLASLALGTAGQVLVSGADAGLPTWQDVATIAAPAVTGAEPALGNPSVNSQVLASNTDGTRSWVTLSRSNVRSTTGNTILDDDFCIRYTGSVDVVFQLPAATGSGRPLRFIHAGSALASLYVSSTANNGSISGDTLVQLTKPNDGDTVAVDISDVDVGIWNLV